MQREQFDITGMHWSTRVERCAAELPGIAEESVSLEDKTASVRLDRSATDDAFKAAVEKCHGTHKTKLGYLERGGFICN